jgi:hypothetical protein
MVPWISQSYSTKSLRKQPIELELVEECKGNVWSLLECGCKPELVWRVYEYLYM